jgi:tRNA/tmRNA/rRNA uracil-C5-methylase (TrmA/RlmC/RlmD family)
MPAAFVGRLVELEVGGAAHGGHCVARHDGQVVFVRHALPGERVRARVTSATKHFLRADAVEVLDASPHRVAAPCPFAGPGRCGGCDWQHADPAYQRRLKGEVVADQLRRLAGIDLEVEAEELPGGPLGWRTRVRFAIDEEGRAGFRRHRSHEVEPVDACLIAHPLVEAAAVESREWNRASEVEVDAAVGTQERVVLVTARKDGRVRASGSGDGKYLHERAIGRTWRVSAGGFWQVHPAAAETLVSAVLAGLNLRESDHALDLYGGVGLFAGALAPHVSSVLAVESSRLAVADARANLADLPGVLIIGGDVGAVLAREKPQADVVVLDPPRSGAGPKVCGAVAATGARAVAYVACDPAALARDVAAFAALGYSLASLRAFDLFPNTHHVECVAVLERDACGRMPA